MLVVIAIIFSLIGLVVAWAFSARSTQKVRATQAAMASLMLAVDTVKNASPIFPDHRLANFFWVQPHTAAPGVQPTWAGANNRRMASGEFLIFLTTLVPSSEKMAMSLGSAYLPAAQVPASWGVAQASDGVLVDVFEQDPSHASALDKDKTSAVFSLVSPAAGYRLRMPVDAWGGPLVYRLSTDRGDLNQSDSDTAVLLDANNNPNGTYKIREHVLQDEQLTRDLYVAAGMPVDAAVATFAQPGGQPTTAGTVEYVRPAVAAYASPFLISAGPDGKWGAFTGGNAAVRDALLDAASCRDANAKDNIYSQEANR